MTDFEKALKNALKCVFPNAKLGGCYFHYCKLIWEAARKNGLTKKFLLDKTIMLVLLLKIIVHITDLQVREEEFNYIKE